MKTDLPQCSRCLNANLEISKRRGRLDGFLSRLGFRPMRCRSCYRRVYIRASRIGVKE